jgi:uncharacterized protein (DUF1919 family)
VRKMFKFERQIGDRIAKLKEHLVKDPCTLISKNKCTANLTSRRLPQKNWNYPYLQYFLGMSSYSNDAPFDASLMVYFRERIDQDLVNKVNQKMVKNARKKEC